MLKKLLHALMGALMGSKKENNTYDKSDNTLKEIVDKNKLRRALAKVSHRRALDNVIEVLLNRQDIMIEYEINTPRRLRHFIAQLAHESWGFRYVEERPSGHSGPNFENYDYRMGNGKGEGSKFRGRGLIQLTGKNNYTLYGSLLGLPLVENPNLAKRPDIALRIACSYWHTNKLNKYADKNNLRVITKKINGRYHGIDDRRDRFHKLAMLEQ